MRKLTKAMIATLMALSVIGCGKSETPTGSHTGVPTETPETVEEKKEEVKEKMTAEALFENLKKSTQDVKDQTYRIYMDIDMNLTYGEDSVSIVSSAYGEAQTDGRNSYSKEETTSSSGDVTEKETTEIYFIDDAGVYTSYENDGEGWVKYSELAPISYSLDFQKMVQANYKDATVEEEDGLYVVRTTIPFMTATEVLPGDTRETIVGENIYANAGDIPAVYQFDMATNELVSVKFDFTTEVDKALNSADYSDVESPAESDNAATLAVHVDTLTVTLSNFEFMPVTITLPEEAKDAPEGTRSDDWSWQRDSDAEPIEENVEPN